MIRLKFNGMKVKGGNSGCPVCGRKKVSKDSFLITKTFVLPSGQSRTFRAGNVYDIPDNDAYFLMQYQAFERV